jgi:hypothetical protein
LSLDAILQRVRDAREALEAAEAEILALSAPPAPPPPPAPEPEAKRGLSDAKSFFAYVRARRPLGPTLSTEEVSGCERILNACAEARFPASWAAYTLATAYHETAGTLKPIREYGKGQGRPYGQPGRNGGQIPYGRGDVQLTHDDNYERADRELGLNGALVRNYDLALDPAISARILVKGMEEGWFTGKGLPDFVPEEPGRPHFNNARRIVNGTDKAALIADYAMTFFEGLRAGGWK